MDLLAPNQSLPKISAPPLDLPSGQGYPPGTRNFIFLRTTNAIIRMGNFAPRFRIRESAFLFSGGHAKIIAGPKFFKFITFYSLRSPQSSYFYLTDSQAAARSIGSLRNNITLHKGYDPESKQVNSSCYSQLKDSFKCYERRPGLSILGLLQIVWVNFRHFREAEACTLEL